MMRLALLKWAIPVLMLAGGGVAFAAGSGTAHTDAVVRAWIDAPAPGETVEVGHVVVQAHASGPGGADSIELFVDGESVDTSDTRGDDRLGTATLDWVAEPGTHELAVRAHGPDGWGELGDPIPVQVGTGHVAEDASAAPTSTPSADQSTTTSAPSDEPATTVAPEDGVTTTVGNSMPDPGSDTTTSAPPSPTTTRPTTTTTTRPPTTTTAPPLPAPSVNVSVSPTSITGGGTFTFTATGQAPGQSFVITVKSQMSPNNPTRPMIVLTTCTSSPCTVQQYFSPIGGNDTYRYSATITAADGRTANAQIRTFTVRPIG